MKAISRYQTQPTIAQLLGQLAEFVDYLLICLLFLFILFYRLQLVVEWITDFRVRELLYAYLYLRALLHYLPRRRLTWILSLMFLYLLYSFLVGLHTYTAYGSEMAVKGFMRFVNVALLGPLFALIINKRQQLLTLIYLWLAVAYLGAASGIYQFFGGDLSGLTQGYIVSRGNLLRFMTLLGEPNIGGMSSAIILLVAIYILQGWVWKALAFAAVGIFILLSLSKAALAGCILALLIVFILRIREKGSNAFIVTPKAIMIGFVLTALTAIVVLLSMSTNSIFQERISQYARTSIEAFTGGGDRVNVSPSFFDDLADRLFGMTTRNLQMLQDESDFYFADVVWGSSFGVAGTAAEEVRGEDVAIAAHNGFVETYFVGGILMLLLFCGLLIAAWRRLWQLARADALFSALFAAFVVCLAYMLTYPVMSSIFVGAFFWLTIGASGNHLLMRETLAIQKQERSNWRPLSSQRLVATTTVSQ